MTKSRSFATFEQVLHMDDAHAFTPCRVLAAPSEMDAVRSAFDSQLVTMTFELPMTLTHPRKPVTVNLHFEVAGAQREYIRYAAVVYEVNRVGPRSRWEFYRCLRFSGSYNAHTRNGFVFLTKEQVDQLHVYAEDEKNILVDNNTGRLFVYR